MKNRTEPSAITTLKPPGCDEPGPVERGPRLRVERQVGVGLVQGTASLASTTMIVFDVPSVILATPVAWSFSKNAPLPTNPR